MRKNIPTLHCKMQNVRLLQSWLIAASTGFLKHQSHQHPPRNRSLLKKIMTKDKEKTKLLHDHICMWFSYSYLHGPELRSYELSGTLTKKEVSMAIRSFCQDDRGDITLLFLQEKCLFFNLISENWWSRNPQAHMICYLVGQT